MGYLPPFHDCERPRRAISRGRLAQIIGMACCSRASRVREGARVHRSNVLSYCQPTLPLPNHARNVRNGRAINLHWITRGLTVGPYMQQVFRPAHPPLSPQRHAPLPAGIGSIGRVALPLFGRRGAGLALRQTSRWPAWLLSGALCVAMVLAHQQGNLVVAVGAAWCAIACGWRARWDVPSRPAWTALAGAFSTLFVAGLTGELAAKRGTSMGSMGLADLCVLVFATCAALAQVAWPEIR